MSDTEERKLSIFFDTSSMPFLKKLICGIWKNNGEQIVLFSHCVPWLNFSVSINLPFLFDLLRLQNVETKQWKTLLTDECDTLIYRLYRPLVIGRATLWRLSAGKSPVQILVGLSAFLCGVLMFSLYVCGSTGESEGILRPGSNRNILLQSNHLSNQYNCGVIIFNV